MAEWIKQSGCVRELISFEVAQHTTGSPVPDAKVSIKNVANGEVREVITNGDGLYSAPNLILGSRHLASGTGRSLANRRNASPSPAIDS